MRFDLRKKVKGLGITLFILGLVGVCGNVAQADDVKKDKVGCDIVFALDVSGSMRKIDQNRTSIEIINMVIDLCEDGDRVGFVAYNDTLAYSYELTDLSDLNKKKLLKSSIEEIKFGGETDIGLGLRSAIDMLSGDLRDSSDPLIIILSDGNTDLHKSKTGRTLDDSKRDIEYSISKAEEYKIPIHTIGFVKSFSDKVDYLNVLAEYTGGISKIATSPFQLLDIINNILLEHKKGEFETISTLISTGTQQKVEVNVNNGQLSELSIMVLSSGKLNHLDIVSKSKEVDITKSNSYALIKIKNPVKETLSLILDYEAGKNVIVSTMGRYSYSEIITLPTSIMKKVPTTIQFQLFNNRTETIVSDTEFYKAMTVDFHIINELTKEDIKVTGKVEGNSIKTSYVFPTTGTYTVQSSYTGEFLKGTYSETFHVNNTLPVPIARIEDTLCIQFGAENYDIDNLFSDGDGDTLNYTIRNIDGDGVEANIEGAILHIKPLHYEDSIITVQAEDENGGVCTTEITIQSLPFWKYFFESAILLFVVLILLITLVISMIIIRYYHKLKKLPQVEFAGNMIGYFLNIKSKNEIPPMKWNMTNFSGEGVTLEEMFQAIEINEYLPDSDKIWFYPTKDGGIQVSQCTKGSVFVGTKCLGKNISVTLYAGETIYIDFEDNSSELELRYQN